MFCFLMQNRKKGLGEGARINVFSSSESYLFMIQEWQIYFLLISFLSVYPASGKTDYGAESHRKVVSSGMGWMENSLCQPSSK